MGCGQGRCALRTMTFRIHSYLQYTLSWSIRICHFAVIFLQSSTRTALPILFLGFYAHTDIRHRAHSAHVCAHAIILEWRLFLSAHLKVGLPHRAQVQPSQQMTINGAHLLPGQSHFCAVHTLTTLV